MNQRKRQVLEAARQLFIEKGFHHTSIQDILSKSSISKGTFYNYFSSKNECFIAILEQARYTASLRRHELILGQDPTDEVILIEQIKVLMQINKEQNLVSIFEGIFHSNDTELHALLVRYRLMEIEWVSNRFIDIFGEETRPYALDLTINFFGMVQHLSMTFRTLYEKSIDTDKIVSVAFRNLKAIIPVTIKNNEILIPQGSLNLLGSQNPHQTFSKGMIIEKLSGFQEELNYDEIPTVGSEFTGCLLDELKRDNVRIAVIEALLKPFHEALIGTPHEAECVELANIIWYFIKHMYTKQ